MKRSADAPRNFQPMAPGLWQIAYYSCRALRYTVGLYNKTRLVSTGFTVDLEGFEPSTSSMPLRRAPNCATGPCVCFPKQAAFYRRPTLLSIHLARKNAVFVLGGGGLVSIRCAAQGLKMCIRGERLLGLRNYGEAHSAGCGGRGRGWREIHWPLEACAESRGERLSSGLIFRFRYPFFNSSLHRSPCPLP